MSHIPNMLGPCVPDWRSRRIIRAGVSDAAIVSGRTRAEAMGTLLLDAVLSEDPRARVCMADLYAEEGHGVREAIICALGQAMEEGACEDARPIVEYLRFLTVRTPYVRFSEEVTHGERKQELERLLARFDDLFAGIARVPNTAVCGSFSDHTKGRDLVEEVRKYPENLHCLMIYLDLNWDAVDDYLFACRTLLAFAEALAPWEDTAQERLIFSEHLGLMWESYRKRREAS